MVNNLRIYMYIVVDRLLKNILKYIGALTYQLELILQAATFVYQRRNYERTHNYTSVHFILHWLFSDPIIDIVFCTIIA